ncbi:WbqC family protein [Aestuariicoccus sp. MJ-SS9]|nr:WbqC family protein [Aestuariicoccus sp. MJ-SS9]
MQPYFLPYAGYFRLFAAADVFVILDDVQFPRRGRVHRCQVPAPGGGERWLTLAVQKAPRDALIRDMQLAPDSGARLMANSAGLPALDRTDTALRRELRALIEDPGRDLTAFLERTLRRVCAGLRLTPEILRSSALTKPEGLTGQDRIVEIVRQMGGTCYVNAPGGRALYDPARFAAAGVALRFLPPYRGRFPHLLPALFTDDIETIRADILGQID